MPVALLLQESPWLYAGANTIHVLGIALLVGAITVLDLRMLGAWRSIPIAAIARPAVTVGATGLTLALASGALLFIVQAGEYLANPLFAVKFAAILLGLLNVAVLRFAGDWTGEHRRRWRWCAGLVSLLAWLTALTAGRMIAYW